MPITDRTRDVVLAAVALATASLCGCAEPEKVPAPVAPRHVSTWRVVVWGAPDDVDAQLRTAIQDELLRRDIATAIVPGSGFVDHILDVSITTVPAAPAHKPTHARKAAAGPQTARHFIADDTVSEGRDAALVPERVFHTGAPPADLPASIADDPVRTLAFTIGAALAPATASASAKPPGAQLAH